MRLNHLPEWLRRMFQELAAYLSGGWSRSGRRCRDFRYVPLALDGISRFQKEALAELRRIRFGHTETYAGIAARLKKRGISASPRAVGQACARNPFPIVVPCHRVLSRDGLGGFGWGIKWKKRLLELEGDEHER